MHITVHSYTQAQRREAAERVHALVLDAVVDVEYHDDGVGRTYTPNTGAPERTLGVLAVCLGRLGMAVQMENDVELGYAELHVAWDKAAWSAAWQ